MQRLRTLVGISLFWIGLSVLGDGLTTLVVPVRLAAVADPAWIATAVGAVTFVALLVGMLVQPVAGAVSDATYPRWGRRGLIALATALIVVSLGAFALLAGTLGILASFVLLTAAASIAQAAQQGFIPDRVERGWRGRAAGLKGFADLTGAFLGFLLLGALMAGGDTVPAVLAVGAVVVASAVLTIALVDEPDRTARPVRARSLRDAYRFDPADHPAFVRVVAARFLFLLGTFAIGRFFLLFVADRLGLDPASAGDEAGGLLAALTLVTALAAIPAGWISDRVGRGATMVGGSILAACGAALLVVASSPLQIAIFGSLLSVGSAAFAAANWAMTSDLVPPDEAARFLGIANVGTAGAAAAAGLLGLAADISRQLLPGLGYGAILVGAVVAFGLTVVVVRPLSAADAGAHPEMTRAASGSEA